MKNLVDKYAYRVDWSEDDQAFVARVLEFPLLSAHGKTRDKAEAEIMKVVRTALKLMNEDGEEVPQPMALRPYSGELRLRMPPEVHRELAKEAEEEGVSLNQLIIARAVRRVNEGRETAG